MVVLIVTLMLMFSVLFVIQMSYPADVPQEPYVKVASIFGCIPLAETPAQFEAKKQFRKEILNEELIRCE